MKIVLILLLVVFPAFSKVKTGLKISCSLKDKSLCTILVKNSERLVASRRKQLEELNTEIRWEPPRRQRDIRKFFQKEDADLRLNVLMGNTEVILLIKLPEGFVSYHNNFMMLLEAVVTVELERLKTNIAFFAPPDLHERPGGLNIKI